MGVHTMPELRLVRGGKTEMRQGAVRFSVTTADAPPEADVLVLEEDTWLILSAELEVTEPAEHPVRLMTELLDTEPVDPGTILVRDRRPFTLLAVVHDFSAEPCCRMTWIAAVLREILAICRERQLHSIQLPLFGVRHGKLKPDTVVPLIVRVIREEAPACLNSVFLTVSPGNGDEVGQILSVSSEAGGQEESGGLSPVNTVQVAGRKPGDDETPEA